MITTPTRDVVLAATRARNVVQDKSSEWFGRLIEGVEYRGIIDV